MNDTVHAVFKTKQIIDTTSTNKWVYLVCKKTSHYNALRLDNVPYISV